MKPLNLDNRPCSPISSNCVVWQGPTLDCINLCTGDTISDVVAKMAEEVCTLLDQTNVDNYDLTCLGITACGPKDFQALIQLLIDKICELNNIDPVDNSTKDACPDCPVTVASCLRETDQGLPATMQLLDYVQMLANKICSLIDAIGDLQIQINNLDIRVTALEEATPPSFTLPSIIVDCTLSDGIIVGGNSYTIDLILNALINDNTYGYCALLGATGLPNDLSSAVQSACITATTPTLSNPPVPFGTEYLGSWVNSPTTVADAINNLWISICDIYDAVSNSSLTVQDTNTIDLEFTGGVLTATINDTGWVDLDGFAFYQAGMSINKPQCRRIGNQIHFRGSVFIPIDNGFGSVISLTSPNTYNNVYRITPHTGIGGIVYDAANRILFNSNGVSAQSIIPTSVLDSGTNLDNQYNSTQLLAIRKLDVEEFIGSPNTGAVTLTAAINLNILQNKTLRIASLTTIEQEPTDMISFAGNSLLRGLTSSFTPRSRVIDFRNYVRQIDGNMSINQAPIIATGGVTGIEIGVLYRIVNYTAGDDFTNIGALVNANNQVFIATGIAPTVWTSSQLIPLSSALHYDTFYNNVPPGYLGSQWPFFADLAATTYDAAIANNLGGFSIKLDGLSVFVSPCTSDIKPTVCP